MRDFNLVTIRLFVAVAQLGRFAAAARREHIVASAISYRINELELATGTKLFRRMPRGAELTEAGQVFPDRSQAILTQLRGLEQEGIGFLRESNIKPFLEAYALQAAPVADGWAQRELKIVWLRGSTLDSAARQFVDFLKSNV